MSQSASEAERPAPVPATSVPPPWTDRLERVAVSLPFRVVLAIGILAFHLAMMALLAHDRFEPTPSTGRPTIPPSCITCTTACRITGRGSSSRAGTRTALHRPRWGLRGLAPCRNKSQLGSGEYPDDDNWCELDFFPTYGYLGAAVVAVTRLPMDYALFGLSLVASFAFLLMWTGKEMVTALGVANTYLSLLLFTLFSTGFTLVTVQTEPVVMALTFGTFLCLRKRWFLAGSLLAGLASAMRVTGVTAGFPRSAPRSSS